MRIMMRALVVGAVTTASLALGGCTVTVSGGHTTVGSAKVADTVEGILEEQAGRRPDVDCGVDDFALEEGETRTCTLTDPESALEYDAVVTLSDIDGADFRVDVDVADQPRSSPTPEPTDESSGTLIVGSDEIARTAESALAGKVEGDFQLVCGNGDLQIATGTLIDCIYSDAAGDRDATVEITKVDGTTYELSVSVG